ncbi:MAG: hypothetical protein AB7T06_38735 [Kofleriaceae bacterium]
MTRIALVLALVSGCSVALQSKPSKRAGVAASECTTSSGLWIADAVGVAASVAAISYGRITDNEDQGNLISGVGAITGLLYTASMGNGIRWTNECRGQQSASMTASR